MLPGLRLAKRFETFPRPFGRTGPDLTATSLDLLGRDSSVFSLLTVAGRVFVDELILTARGLGFKSEGSNLSEEKSE